MRPGLNGQKAEQALVPPYPASDEMTHRICRK
jgi:hypothetical protein